MSSQLGLTFSTCLIGKCLFLVVFHQFFFFFLGDFVFNSGFTVMNRLEEEYLPCLTYRRN